MKEAHQHEKADVNSNVGNSEGGRGGRVAHAPCSRCLCASMAYCRLGSAFSNVKSGGLNCSLRGLGGGHISITIGFSAFWRQVPAMYSLKEPMKALLCVSWMQREATRNPVSPLCDAFWGVFGTQMKKTTRARVAFWGSCSAGRHSARLFVPLDFSAPLSQDDWCWPCSLFCELR